MRFKVWNHRFEMRGNGLIKRWVSRLRVRSEPMSYFFLRPVLLPDNFRLHFITKEYHAAASVKESEIDLHITGIKSCPQSVLMERKPLDHAQIHDLNIGLGNVGGKRYFRSLKILKFWI